MQETVLSILEDLTGTSEVRENLDVELFDEGLLDSMGTVQLLVELDGQLGVNIPVSEFERDEWSTPNKIIAKVIDPYLTVLNSLPKVALGPLIIIWVGASTNSIIFMALLISTFVTIITIYQGFAETNQSYITLLKSFGANKRQIFMKAILHIETSTPVCSVALSLDGGILYEKISYEGPSHAALVGVYVQEALDVLRAEGLQLSAVAVSSGPGSYTGLRIGVSVAKGLCFGFGIPLISIPTLKLMALEAVKRNGGVDSLYCAMLDARRMEVYAAIFDKNLNEVRAVSADIIDANSYSAYLEKEKVCFFGNGSDKCKTVLTSPNAEFIYGVVPQAANMLALAEEKYGKGDFENVAYYEPFYLKEFQATKAKNKVLG